MPNTAEKIKEAIEKIVKDKGIKIVDKPEVIISPVDGDGDNIPDGGKITVTWDWD